MTVQDFVNAGIAIDDTPEALLYAEAALDWIKNNTTIPFTGDIATDLSNLPAGAKLFILRYGTIMQRDTTVSSESLGGMSQSFRESSSYDLLYDLASQLLGNYLASQVSFVASQRTWDYGC